MKAPAKPVWVAGGVLFVLATGAGLYLNLAPRPAPEAAAPVPAPAPVSAPVPAAVPAAPAAPPLPSLQDSDAAVRTKVAALSLDPGFSAWLKPASLLRRAAAAADVLSRGRSPKDSLVFLAPRGGFTVRRRGGVLAASPRAFARYDAAARVVASLDAGAAARLEGEFEPLLDEACREQGCTGSFRETLVRGLLELLAAPVPAAPPRLKPAEKGIVFAYADPRLEKLSLAQKQLLRMGPRNQAAVQAKLRELARALGVPDDRLPPPSSL